MEDLNGQSCKPCNLGTPKLTYIEAKQYLALLDQGWRFVHELANHPFIERAYTMNNFQEALDFITKIGAVAEQEGHHPDIHLTKYREIRLQLMTHAVKGLTQNDFILAAKIDAIR